MGINHSLLEDYFFPICTPRSLFQRLDRGIPRANTVLVRAQILNLLICQRKVKDASILLNSRGRHALDERNVAPLHAPAQQDLCRSLAVLLGQLLDLGVVVALCAHNGAVGLDGDIPLVAPLDNVWARQPGVKLPLADGNDASLARSALRLELLDVALELVEMVHAKVGDTDGAHLFGLDSLDERTPGALATFWTRRMGPVDEDEIQVRELGLVNGRIDEFLDVLVARSRVDVSVANLQSLSNAISGLVCGSLVNTKPEDRKLVARPKLDS